MMQLRKVIGLGLLIVLAAGLSVIPVFGGTGPEKVPANWDKVKRLPVGREILVVQNDTKTLQGKLRSVNDEDLVIRLATGEQTLSKGSILRISSRGASHRWRNAALGAGAGFGAGTVIGAAAGQSDWIGGRAISAAAGASIGILAGAVVGAVLPTGGWHEVYRAQ